MTQRSKPLSTTQDTPRNNNVQAEDPRMWVLVAEYEDGYEEILGGLYCQRYMIEYLAKQEREAANGEYEVCVALG